jgi:hypothetical protein
MLAQSQRQPLLFLQEVFHCALPIEVPFTANGSGHPRNMSTGCGFSACIAIVFLSAALNKTEETWL